MNTKRGTQGVVTNRRKALYGASPTTLVDSDVACIGELAHTTLWCFDDGYRDVGNWCGT